MTLNPSRNTLTLAQHTPRMLILTTSRAHTLLGNNTRKYRTFRTNYTCLQNNLKSIQMQSYSTLSWENPKLDVNVQNLKAIFLITKKSNLFFLFVLKHKQTIYTFQRLVKAFNRGAYSVGNHLKHTQPPKQNFVRIFKETIDWNHETIDCFGLTTSQPTKTVFNLFKNT